MGEPRGLLLHRLDDVLVGVADGHHADAGGEVDELVAVDVEDDAAVGARGVDRRTHRDAFGDDAEPVDKAVENAVAGLRVHVAPRSAEIEALKRRLENVTNPRGGEIVLVAGIDHGREVELKLPGRFTLDASVRGALKTAPGVVFVEDI